MSGPSLKSVPEMLDEFAGIDTRSEAHDPKHSPIASQISHISDDVGLRRGSVAAKQGRRVGRS
jgi:hypothetical protein